MSAIHSIATGGAKYFGREKYFWDDAHSYMFKGLNCLGVNVRWHILVLWLILFHEIGVVEVRLNYLGGVLASM